MKNKLGTAHLNSLLPIFSKILEKFIFECLFKFLVDKLLFDNQSGFRPNHSCTS